MPLIAAHTLRPDQGSLPIYNGFDACTTWQLDDIFRGWNDESAGLAYDFERALQAPVMEMSLRGFRIAVDARQTALENTSAKLTAAEAILNALAVAVWDRGVNPNSGEQLKALFYGAMGIRPLAISVKGERKEPMDRKVLERLEDYFHPRPIINAVLLCRDLAKTLQVLTTEIDQDWRWRSSYNIAGTDSWRFSSSKSLAGTGNNAQNITAELRRIFVPDPGYRLYAFDKEQAEAREVGFLCGVLFNDWSYLDAAESGDLHTAVTRLVWRDFAWTGDLRKDRAIAEQMFYRRFTYRDASKRLAHGSNYFGKPPALSAQIKIPLNLVIPFQERYFAAFPCIPRMHQWVAEQLQTKQRLTNVFGISRDFFARPDSEETLRSAIAHMFQSATAFDTNLGMWRLWKHEPERIQLLSQQHDAVVFQSPEYIPPAEIVARAQELMTVELFHNGRRFVVPTEAKAGYNWAPRYKTDETGALVDWNPRGLEKVRV